MAKLITIPSSPNFQRSAFSLSRAVSATVSPFTGKTKTQEYDMVAWMGEFSLPPMNRTTARDWQAFLLEANGIANYFHLTDPDAKTPQGTYDQNTLLVEDRINGGTEVSSITLSFSGSTITASSGSPFNGLVAGDFFFVAGATNDENNGTHKIVTKTNNTTVVTGTVLTTESNTASCSLKQNTKGSTGLCLQASSNTGTGTIKKGDYLGLWNNANTAASGAESIQLVMATEDATLTTQSGSGDHYSVAIQPKLRSSLTNGWAVGFKENYNVGRFRLESNAVSWDANNTSIYGIGFNAVEVI